LGEPEGGGTEDQWSMTIPGSGPRIVVRVKERIGEAGAVWFEAAFGDGHGAQWWIPLHARGAMRRVHYELRGLAVKGATVTGGGRRWELLDAVTARMSRDIRRQCEENSRWCDAVRQVVDTGLSSERDPPRAGNNVGQWVS